MRADETLNQATPGANLGPAHRRPYWIVGLGLLGLVVVLLAGAFLLDKQLRPRVGIETPPAAATTASPTSAAPAIAPPTLRPTSEPTARPVATATATASAAAPIVTDGPGGLRVATSPLEREMEAAYLHYWEVRTQAYLDLDTSHLGEVMAGPELTRAEAQIRQLRAQGRAGKLDVDHRIAFVKVTPDEAEIYDEYLNRSVFLDATTKQELPTKEPPSVEKISFKMRKIDGKWKVVDGTRYE